MKMLLRNVQLTKMEKSLTCKIIMKNKNNIFIYILYLILKNLIIKTKIYIYEIK